MNKLSLLIFTIFLMFGCVVDQGKIVIDIKRKVIPTSNPSTLASANVSNVQIINNQLVITGSGLTGVANVKVDGNSLDQNFTIETKSATQIIANATNAFSFDVSKVFNLILSDANAAATFPIDFSLCNATLNGYGFNCAVTASDKDVLSYDVVSGKWKPRAINGLTYQGTWDATAPEPSGSSSGDYFIVSVASAPYAIGDWIVWNGAAYDKISNSTTITSVFGRNGAIVATEGDYNLDKLLDVDLTVPATVGKVLKYDGMKWIAGDDLSGGGAGSVTATEIVNGAVTDAKIDSVSASKITGTLTSAQIADGTIVNADINAAAAIDYSKLNIPAGSIPYSKITIANGDIPAAKISGLPAATSVLTTTITDTDSTHAPDGNAVFDALGLKLNKTGGTLTIGTISGVPTPTNSDDVANKGYVDSAISGYTSFTEAQVLGTDLLGLNTGVAGPIAAADTVLGAMGKLQYQVTDLKANGQWIKTGNDISYSAGNVSIDKTLIFKDSTTNTIEVKAPAAVTSYVLTLPVNDGNADQVLKTDGSGVLSWVNVNDTNVQTFAKTTLPTCGAGEVLKSNGTSFSCVTDVSGGGAFTGANNKAVATDGSGALTSSSTSATELGYVAGVTSSIQTQLDAKQATITVGTSAQYYRGDKTFVTLDTAVVPENGNLYFTTARAKTATVADAIADAVIDVAPSQNAVFDALAGKLNTTGGNITPGYLTVPTPVLAADAANKGYVDSQVAALGSSTNVAEGTNLYFTEARVRATLLTGLNTGVAGPITATDDVLGAFGKMQYQVTDLKAKGQWEKTGSDVYYSAGDVRVDNNLKFKDSGTNYAFIKAPGTITSNYTLTLPVDDGGSNQVLTTNGSGVLSWTTPASAVPTGAAGGDLSGTYPNPTITGLDAAKIDGGAVSNAEYNYLDGVTSSIQTQLTGKQTSDATLTALATYNTDGIVVQTAADTFVGRSIAGTANRVTVTNGDGVAGNPTLNIDTVLLPSPVVGDIGKFLKATAANASVWTSMASGDVTTALGFTPVNKAGDSMTTGTFALSGTAALTVQDPVNVLDVANKQYVDSFGQWTKGTGGNSGDLYRSSGNVGLGTSTPAANTILDIASTTKAFAPPRMTKAQRDAIATPTAGLMVFNTTDNTVDYFNGTSWLGLNGAPKYIKLGMSAYQTVNNNDIVAFDTTKASSGITRSGNGAALKAGVTYRIEASLSTVYTTDTHYVGYVLYNGTSNFGSTAYTFDGDEQTWGFKAPILEIYKPAVDETVSLRIIDDHLGTGSVSHDYNTHLIVTELSGSSPIPGSDNLGNHIATQNLNMASYFISPDGGNKGLRVTNGGITSSPQSGQAGLIFNQNSDFVAGTVGSGMYMGSSAASGNTTSLIQAFKTGNTVATGLLLQPFSGGVSINRNAAPLYDLDVYGGARINSIVGGELNGLGNFHLDARSTGATYLNWMSGTGGAYVGNGAAGFGTISAAAFTVNSDRTLKKNIVPIENALDIILNINGVKFDWISKNETPVRQVGVIAQDVKKVLPELVSVSNQTKKLTVNYPALVAPLIEAVKELYHKWFNDSSEIHRKIASVKIETEVKIRNLEAENAILKARALKIEQENAAIKARLYKIEKALGNRP